MIVIKFGASFFMTDGSSKSLHAYSFTIERLSDRDTSRVWVSVAAARLEVKRVQLNGGQAPAATFCGHFMAEVVARLVWSRLGTAQALCALVRLENDALMVDQRRGAAQECSDGR
jgi:hypothetical protein